MNRKNLTQEEIDKIIAKKDFIENINNFLLFDNCLTIETGSDDLALYPKDLFFKLDIILESEGTFLLQLSEKELISISSKKLDGFGLYYELYLLWKSKCKIADNDIEIIRSEHNKKITVKYKSKTYTYIIKTDAIQRLID